MSTDNHSAAEIDDARMSSGAHAADDIHAAAEGVLPIAFVGRAGQARR
jgi:hypothetical protein